MSPEQQMNPEQPHINVVPPTAIKAGRQVQLQLLGVADTSGIEWYRQDSSEREVRIEGATGSLKIELATGSLPPGEQTVVVRRERNGQHEVLARNSVTIVAETEVEGLAREVRNLKSPPDPTDDQALWVAIRECVNGRRFKHYEGFVNDVLCAPLHSTESAPYSNARSTNGHKTLERDPHSCFYGHGIRGYELLKAATEVFLLCNACCGELDIHGFPTKGELDAKEASRLGREATLQEMKDLLTKYLVDRVSPRTLPYLDSILNRLKLTNPRPASFPFCSDNFRKPCLFELIWSYWHEEGMLVQAVNAISLRFQNRRLDANGRSPLANFELDPLRPLNNLLWGYIQDEPERLTVKRRAYEYDHEYGLQLVGKAVGGLDSADRRSKFIAAFHNLLHECARFFEDLRNTWIKPDDFRLLNAIIPVHTILAEGAHNQYGDLPSTARMEMLIQQWLFAQPPMREFLQSRAMVPYAEDWMPQVDALKQIMGWTDVSVSTFHNLATDGELILLSLRYGDWTEADAGQAFNWAQYWRPEIQRYIQEYKTATGVDLGVPRTAVTPAADMAVQPAIHLQRRLQGQQAAPDRNGQAVKSTNGATQPVAANR